MDWSPQIVVKAEDDVSISTSVTALKTFATGFPDAKATVHCIGRKGHTFCKQWAKDGGHSLLNYPSTTKSSQLHYEIVKRTRLPVALIAGTTVFYDDVSDYNTTKVFGADIVPQWNKTDKIINVESVEKTLIFVAKPTQVISTLNEITKYTSTYTALEGKESFKWGSQQIVMGGKIYYQGSGIFNMIYNYDSSLMSNFNTVTASKYETVFGGGSIPRQMKSLEDTGHDTKKLMVFVNAAVNEDWEGVKGYRKTFIDMIN